MRLLIVDNSMAVRARLIEMFATIPAIEIIQAGELAEGFEQVRRSRPDVMVLDPMFPDGNGLDLLCYAKQNLPSMIVMVNTNVIFFRKHCMELGADVFFDKSLEFTDLVGSIVSCSDQPMFISQP